MHGQQNIKKVRGNNKWFCRGQINWTCPGY